MGGGFAYAFNIVENANIHIMLGFSMWILIPPAEPFQQMNIHYFLALNLFVKLFLVSASYLIMHFTLPAR